jgi:hypothetical protein
MRIDISAHLGRWPFRPFEASIESLLKRMDRTDVDLAVVSNLHGLFYQNPQRANEELHEWLAASRAASSRFIPFAVINPSYPDWHEDVRVCFEAFGFRGIRLYPQYHDYWMNDSGLSDLLSWAEASGVPVGFSLRMVDARGRSWLDTPFAEGETEQLRLETICHAIAGFPKLRCMILQSIFEPLGPEAERILRSSDILFDTVRASTCGVAGPNSYDWKKESVRFGEARFAFGSMAPFSDELTPILRTEAGILSPSQAAALAQGNARAFLKL